MKCKQVTRQYQSRIFVGNLPSSLGALTQEGGVCVRYAIPASTDALPIPPVRHLPLGHNFICLSNLAASFSLPPFKLKHTSDVGNEILL